MFENFTDAARRVVVLAQEEARTLGHGDVGPEHLLIALTRDLTIAAHALAGLGADGSAVAGTVLAVSDRESSVRTGTIPFTPVSRKIMAASQQVAARLGSNNVQPVHLLFAVTIIEDPVTSDVLRLLGITPEEIQEALGKLLVTSGDYIARADREPAAPQSAAEVFVARAADADADATLHFDHQEALRAAGDGGSVNDGRITLRSGEFFSIRDNSYVRDDLRYLDYATARDTAESAGAQVCVMVPSTRSVAALAADGSEVIVGSTTEWSAASVESRVTVLGQ